MSPPIGVVLMNYGGPQRLDEVEPFLRSIFNDPRILAFPPWLAPLRPAVARLISGLRAHDARAIYARLGGGSPLNRLTAEQAAALQAALEAHGDFRVVVAMRYIAPRAAEAVRQLAAVGVRRAVLLPLYPQFSTATTSSSLEDFADAARGSGLELLAIESFHELPGYLAAVAADIAAAYERIPEAERELTPLVLSAHGLPLRVVKRGDPYPRQVQATARAVVDRLPFKPPVVISYQSKVGPIRWLEPSTMQVLDEFARRSVQRVVVYPLSFVSEHSETLYELDMLLGDRARAAGIDYHRVPALHVTPGFIAALAERVVQAAS